MMPPITLTDDARAMLVSYHWPGNVRQLKNITEQVSVIERERTITPDILQKYIPYNEGRMLPVSVSKLKEADSRSFANEREILYQVLFDMKKDISDLKQVVKDIMHTAVPSTDHPIANSSTPTIITGDSPRVSVPVKYEEFPPTLSISNNKVHDIQDATEYEESTKSISEVEKEMIAKALARHNGKRKSAASDLGISERTLYRKIKEYGL
jgi:transcriptional regulator with PAS, ATPase and Fis domain